MTKSKFLIAIVFFAAQLFVQAQNNYLLVSTTAGNVGPTPVNAGWSVHYGHQAGLLTDFTGVLDGEQVGMNCFIGPYAAQMNTLGYNNVFLGYQSGLENTTGHSNIYIGKGAGRYSAFGKSNVAIGLNAVMIGDENTLLGNGSGGFVYGTGGNRNLFLGYQSGYASSGNDNVFIGYQAGQAVTGNDKLIIGGRNSIVELISGDFASRYLKFNVNMNTPGINSFVEINGNNNASGLRFTNLTETSIAPLNTNSRFLTVNASGDVVLNSVPSGALSGNFWSLTGNAGTNAAVNFIGTTDNVDLVFKRSNTKAGFIGTTTTSLGNSSGSLGLNNTFIGADSGKNVFNPSGSNNNTAVGYQAGRSISGSVGGHSGLNTIMGYQAGFGVTGGKNTIIGSSSSVTSGSNNVVLGSGAGISSGSNNIVIGPGAGNVSPLNGQSNQLIIDADNSPNANPLIYGRFDTDNLVFNVNTGAIPFSSAVEINGRNQESGLRFRNLTSAFVPNASETKFLTVETNGNVVLRNLPSGFATTNALASAANTMTSNVNGVVSSASIVNSLTTNVTGNTLTTTVNGVSSSVTLPSSSITDTDQQTLSVNGDQLTISNGNTVTLPSITEIDGDVTNELQTLSQNGNVVTLSNNGGSFSLPVDTDTDDQTLSINGTTLSISEGNSVEIPATALQAGDNITITGSGATADPFVISSTASGLNIYNSDGTIDTTGTVGDNPNPGLRTVTMGNNNLFFNTASSSFDEDTAGSGRVYIGNTINFPNIDTTAPENSQYRLLVEGGVLTEKVKVALRSGTDWRDNVFEETYTLKPLSEVEAFIKENKHLPGIESASELVENGLDVGEMQAKQMEKIEELTLYTIEQQKILEKQQKEIEELKAQVKALLTKN